MAFFNFHKKVVQPRSIDAIIESFNNQMAELDNRISYDEDQIISTKALVENLLNETARLEKDVERSKRIKSKISELIK